MDADRDWDRPQRARASASERERARGRDLVTREFIPSVSPSVVDAFDDRSIGSRRRDDDSEEVDDG